MGTLTPAIKRMNAGELIKPERIAEKAAGADKAPAAETSRPFEKILTRINSELNGLERRTSQAVKAISGEARTILELQIDVNRISIETQLAVKAAETVTGSIKQLQQLSNG